MSAFDVANGWPGLVGAILYFAVQICMAQLSQVKSVFIILIAALVAFVGSVVVAKLQGNDWLVSAEGGIVVPFLFVLIDLGICSMRKSCNSSPYDEQKLATDLSAAIAKINEVTSRVTHKAS